jgi:hypothetical protein
MKYRKLKGYKYQLLEDYSIQTAFRLDDAVETLFILLMPHGLLRIRYGYSWDGCSGPTWDDTTNMRAGLVHDACYQLIREGYIDKYNKAYADRLFREILIEDGMSSIRASYYYYAVKYFGNSALKPRGKS